MLQGKVQSAIRYLSRNINRGVLKLEDLIPKTIVNGGIVQQSTHDVFVNTIIFDGLGADSIRQTALHGAVGPSGLDAYAWRRLCT